jgi:hypothetical protein
MDVHDSLKLKVLEAENLPSPSGLPPTTYVEIVLGEWVLFECASCCCRLLTPLSMYLLATTHTQTKRRRGRGTYPTRTTRSGMNRPSSSSISWQRYVSLRFRTPQSSLLRSSEQQQALVTAATYAFSRSHGVAHFSSPSLLKQELEEEEAANSALVRIPPRSLQAADPLCSLVAIAQ